MSSFIDKFLDITNSLPREIIRILKLYKFVEERSRHINTSLKESRLKYLNKMKTNDIKEDEKMKNEIQNYYKELMDLSEYKQNLIKDLEFIIENDFLKKLPPIIEEGQKECKEQMATSNLNLPYGASSFTNSIYNNATNEDKSVSEFNEKNEKMVGHKTKRVNKKKNKEKNINNGYEEIGINQEENDVHCTCNRESYGDMIECDDCGRWFHYGCVKIKIGEEPDNWSCMACKQNKPNKKKKKEKK